MSARDYAVTFPYGATAAPYSPSSPHRGNDRPCPTGTPIVIGDTTIGLTGSTGWATGPHLHTQAGSDRSCQNTLDPTPYEFQGGTVIQVGEASQWGKYVIIEVVPGSRYICYAHLSQVNVRTGEKIMSAQSLTKEEVIELFNGFYGNNWLGKDYDFHNVGGSLEQWIREWGNSTATLKNKPASSTDADKKLQAIKDALGIK